MNRNHNSACKKLNYLPLLLVTIFSIMTIQVVSSQSKIELDKKKQVVRVVLSRITEIKTGLIFGINHTRGFPLKMS